MHRKADWWTNYVHAAGMLVQEPTSSLEFPMYCLDPIRRHGMTYLVQHTRKPRHHFLPRHGCAVQIQHQMAEPHIRMAQPLDDRIQRRTLLRDEKNAAPVGHALRYYVRDGLALASSWWAVYDTILTPADKHNRALLCGVCIEHEVVVGRGTLIELGWLDTDRALGKFLSRGRRASDSGND